MTVPLHKRKLELNEKDKQVIRNEMVKEMKMSRSSLAQGIRITNPGAGKIDIKNNSIGKININSTDDSLFHVSPEEEAQKEKRRQILKHGRKMEQRYSNSITHK